MTTTYELYYWGGNFAGRGERMDADEKIKAFLDSDRCTKMENLDNTPLSKAPLVQVNSFM